MTAAYISLENSSTTIDLNDVTGSLPKITMRRGWRPRPGRLSTSPLDQLYPDIGESLPLRAIGADEGEARGVIGDLIDHLDHARQWRNGAVSPINNALLIYITLEDGPVCVATVKESPLSSTDILNLPADYSFAGQVVIDFDLPFVRMGTWLDEVPDTPGFSTAVENPGLMSVTFTDDVALPSPTNVYLSEFAAATMVPGYLLVAKSEDDFHIEEGEDATDDTTAGTWAAVGGPGGLARGGFFGRWSAVGTAWQSVSFTLEVFAQRVAIFASIRIHDSDRTWQVKASTTALNASGGIVNSETTPVTLAYNGGDPQIVPLGTVFSAGGRHDRVDISFRVSDDTSAPQIDFDYFVVVSRDGDANHIVHVLPQAGLSGDFSIEFRHNFLERPTPAIWHSGVFGVQYLGYDSPPVIYSTGDNLTAMWLATKGAFWRHVNNAGDTVLALKLQGARSRAYLVPE